MTTILDHGLDNGPATALVGENGSGKSTIIEAIALAYGLSPEGGSTGAQHRTRSTESVLADHLQLVRTAGTTRRGYSLRAETMHGFFTYLESHPSTNGPDVPFHEMSHGESFLELGVVHRITADFLHAALEGLRAGSAYRVSVGRRVARLLLCERRCSASCSLE
ncbi:AAA family ATPase [Arthrobacter sp. N1]|uniref:AAA family ATPase n=1 Tax=Arthrobacter sp. N1 TaxID=619291 RepID=UPI003BB0020D